MSEADKNPWIIDSTDDNFQADAVDSSYQRLVLVDFWASWCQPCRMLTPNLEAAVDRFNGDVHLIKVNTEVAPETAQSFQVASIPTVYAMLDGNPVDYFQGVIETDEIDRWIQQLLRHRQILEADSLTDTNPASAIPRWDALLEKDSENAILLIGKARALVGADRVDEANDIITALKEDRGFLEPEAEKVAAMIRLGINDTNSQADDLRAKLLETPDDLSLKLNLAESLAGTGEYPEAFELAIDVYAKDKLGIGKQAHEFLLTAFKALPEDDENVHTYRRKLAMLMY